MPAEFARAAGLRNRLAHAYDTIDDEALYHAIPTALAQLRLYGAYVLAYVDTIESTAEDAVPGDEPSRGGPSVD